MPEATPTTTPGEPLIPTPSIRMPVGKPWTKGVSGNPSGRPKQHALDILLELKLTDFDLAAELVKAAKAGEGWAVRYIYDRLAGMPVQRHEAKLLAQVDDTAQLLAKAYGLSVDEVRDRARQIAQGT